jgi:hypothetical protein
MIKKKYFIYLLFLLSLISACTKVDISFGNYYLDNNYTQIIKIDTFSSELSTVYLDSFTTSNKGSLWIGGYTDPEFGIIKTKAYTELIPPTYTNSFANSSFDSIALIIKLNKSYYGDTTQLLHIDVNRLSEPISTYETSPLVLYNTQQFASYSTSIGAANVVIRPNLTDSISIRLSDDLGKEFLQILQNPENTEMKSASAFVKYFKGIELNTSASSKLVLGCKDSLVMRLYYKTTSLYSQNTKLDFGIPSDSANNVIDAINRFTYISSNRAGTALQNLNAQVKEIGSSQTGNAAYSQYLTQVVAKLRFPNIREILKIPNFMKLEKANLIIRPVQKSYGNYVTLPPTMTMYLTSQLNLIGANFVTVSGAKGTVQTGNLSIDDLYGQNTNYNYDITDYIKSQIADATINKNGLLIIPGGDQIYNNQFSRVKIGDKNNSNGKLELQLFYISVQ